MHQLNLNQTHEVNAGSYTSDAGIFLATTLGGAVVGGGLTLMVPWPLLWQLNGIPASIFSISVIVGGYMGAAVGLDIIEENK